MNSRDEITHDTLLAVYVQVTLGASPVLNAAVKMDIKVRLDNGSVLPVTNSSMVLFDNGLGEPDIVRGDGVYSRYLTRYPTPGRYTFSISVDDNNGSAVTVVSTKGSGRSDTVPAVPKKPLKAGISTCCGSSVPVSQESLKKTGVFRRRFDGLPASVEVRSIPLSPERIRP